MEGGCDCGQLRYRLTSAPIFVNCCHCSMCQRASGSAFALNAMIEADRVEVTSGTPEPTETPHGDRGERCPNCHTQLWCYHRMFGPTLRFVRVGSLDDPIAPDAHFFVSRKHPWVTIPAGVPAYSTLPGEGDDAWPPEAHARVEAAMGGPLAGSAEPR